MASVLLVFVACYCDNLMLLYVQFYIIYYVYRKNDFDTYIFVENVILKWRWFSRSDEWTIQLSVAPFANFSSSSVLLCFIQPGLTVGVAYTFIT